MSGNEGDNKNRFVNTATLISVSLAIMGLATVVAKGVFDHWDDFKGWFQHREQHAPVVPTPLQARIEGHWLLHQQDQPPGVRAAAYMRAELDGTRLKVIGESWKGKGSFDFNPHNGEYEGYYDWEFDKDSGITSGKTGFTDIKLDPKTEILFGNVHGSGIDWSYWAVRQHE